MGGRKVGREGGMEGRGIDGDEMRWMDGEMGWMDGEIR